MEEFFRRYEKLMRKFVAQKIDDEGVAEEITLDILWAAYKSLPSFRHGSSELSFVYSIAKHKIIDYYRKKKLKTILFSINPMFEEVADQALNPERDVLKNELKAEIKKTLKELNEGYGKILRLKYIDGLKIRAIAKKLKLSIKAVESRLIRAKKQFKNNFNYVKKAT
jgi:RNA polymerase sigma-70 factor (ECF subfamily)